MYVRDRSRSMAGPQGRAIRRTWGGSPRQWHVTYDDVAGYVALQETMHDIVGNKNGQNSCIQEKITRSGGYLTYSATAGFQQYEITSWPVGITHIGSASHLPITGAPTLTQAATEVASRTNPSKPSIGLPVSIAELREIPRLLFMRKPDKGNSVLASEFGWQPLLRDVQAAFRLPQSIESRLKTIRALSVGAISRQRTVFSGSAYAEENSNIVINSTPLTINSHLRTIETSMNIRGTCKWQANFDAPSLTDKELWKLAARVVGGVDSAYALAAIWELLPWSWLIDYFSNVGDLISLTNNALASPIGGVALSTVTTTTKTWYSNNLGMMPFVYKRRTWTRDIEYPGLSFHMPLLTHGQLSILLNLANSNRRTIVR